MSKKRLQIHLNVAELVLFEDDMMYYCNFPLFNERNSSLFSLTIHQVDKGVARGGVLGCP